MVCSVCLGLGLTRIPCHADDFMSYIVVSFMNATIVLSIGETVVEVSIDLDLRLLFHDDCGGFVVLLCANPPILRCLRPSFV